VNYITRNVVTYKLSLIWSVQLCQRGYASTLRRSDRLTGSLHVSRRYFNSKTSIVSKSSEGNVEWCVGEYLGGLSSWLLLSFTQVLVGVK